MYMYDIILDNIKITGGYKMKLLHEDQFSYVRDEAVNTEYDRLGLVDIFLSDKQINQIKKYCIFIRNFRDDPLLVKYQDNKHKHNQFFEVNLRTGDGIIDTYYLKIGDPLDKILF